MDIVERVARAIYPTRGKRDFESFTEAFYTEMEAQQLERSRAAIAAMRAPTEAMLQIGSGNGGFDQQWVHDNTSDIWTAMIDAALAEAPDAA